MKTKEELLKFYGVEIGKKYKVYDHVYDWNAGFDGKIFEVGVNAVYGNLFIEFDNDDMGAFEKSSYKINFLDNLYYCDAAVLDKEEGEYLSNVIRPFKNRVIYITLYQIQINDKEQEYIIICLKSRVFALGEIISLPCFKSGMMYKGMTLNKRYTLAELGLV